MIVKYHNHSTIACNDTQIDLATGIVSYTHEDTWHEYGPAKIHFQSWLTRGLEVSAQTAIYNTLLPLIELTRKYPNRRDFVYFSRKHRYFYTGRLNKALTLVGTSDYHGIDCLAHVFILPVYGIVVRYYAGAQDGYKAFTLTVKSSIDWADCDYSD